MIDLNPFNYIVAGLITCLGSPDFKCREEASRTLASLNGTPPAALQAACEDGDLEVRRRSRLIIENWINKTEWPVISEVVKEGLLDSNEVYTYIHLAVIAKQGHNAYNDYDEDFSTGEYYTDQTQLYKDACKMYVISHWHLHHDLQHIISVSKIKAAP